MHRRELEGVNRCINGGSRRHTVICYKAFATKDTISRYGSAIGHSADVERVTGVSADDTLPNNQWNGGRASVTTYRNVGSMADQIGLRCVRHFI